MRSQEMDIDAILKGNVQQTPKFVEALDKKKMIEAARMTTQEDEEELKDNISDLPTYNPPGQDFDSKSLKKQIKDLKITYSLQ